MVESAPDTPASRPPEAATDSATRWSVLLALRVTLCADRIWAPPLMRATFSSTLVPEPSVKRPYTTPRPAPSPTAPPKPFARPVLIALALIDTALVTYATDPAPRYAFEVAWMLPTANPPAAPPKPPIPTAKLSTSRSLRTADAMVRLPAAATNPSPCTLTPPPISPFAELIPIPTKPPPPRPAASPRTRLVASPEISTVPAAESVDPADA